MTRKSRRAFALGIAIGLIAGLALAAGINAAAAKASVSCGAPPKQLSREQCAFWNAADYIVVTYPYVGQSLVRSWVAPSPYGRFHYVWRVFNVSGGLLVPQRVKVSAKRCGNTFVIYNHRAGAWGTRC